MMVLWLNLPAAYGVTLCFTHLKKLAEQKEVNVPQISEPLTIVEDLLPNFRTPLMHFHHWTSPEFPGAYLEFTESDGRSIHSLYNQPHIHIVDTRGIPRNGSEGKGAVAKMRSVLRAVYPELPIAGMLADKNLEVAENIIRENPTEPNFSLVPSFRGLTGTVRLSLGRSGGELSAEYLIFPGDQLKFQILTDVRFDQWRESLPRPHHAIIRHR